jgi:hypothetical protein
VIGDKANAGATRIRVALRVIMPAHDAGGVATRSPTSEDEMNQPLPPGQQTEDAPPGMAVPEGLDIGECVKAPFEDDEWIKKSLLMGVFMLIPIAGAFNLLGWMKACYAHRRAGQMGLPEAGLSYIGDGFKVFLAMLPIIGVLIAWQIVGAVATAILPGKIAGLVGGLFGLSGGLLGLAVGFLAPAIFYVHLAEGEAWASIKIDRLKNAMLSKGVVTYAMLWVAILVAGFLGGIGSIACGIGAIFTAPLGYAMQGIAIAQFQHDMES